MTKTEFLDTLANSLNHELPSDKVNENINYYDDYINQSMAKGKSLDDIFNELGEPRLIAKTIIDTYKLSKGYQYKQETNSMDYEDDSRYENTYSNTNSNDNKYKGNDWNIKFGFGAPIPWYQKLLGILLLILVIFVVITLGSIAINLFFSIGIPILFVYVLYRIIINMFHRRY